MDLLTHTLLTRKVIGKRLGVMLAGIGPDIPWHFTYPVWVIAQGKAGHAFTTGEWPEPPRWIETLHIISHSLPSALAVAAIARLVGGRWPRQELAAWTLHIAVDIPTHSRQFWGPRFLWPLSDVSVDGVPWAEITSRALAAILQAFRQVALDYKFLQSRISLTQGHCPTTIARRGERYATSASCMGGSVARQLHAGP